MSEVPKRDQWWWSAEQLRAAGWTHKLARTGEAIWHLWESASGVVPCGGGPCAGAFVDQPPPPKLDETLVTVAAKLFPDCTYRPPFLAGGKPFALRVEDGEGTVVDIEEPTREDAGFMLVRAYISRQPDFELRQTRITRDRRGVEFEVQFAYAPYGRQTNHQTVTATDLGELVRRVHDKVQRLPVEPLTDEEVRNIGRRLRELAEQKPPGHPDRKDIEYAASVVDHALGWDCRREQRPHGGVEHAHPRNERLHRAIRRRPR